MYTRAVYNNGFSIFSTISGHKILSTIYGSETTVCGRVKNVFVIYWSASQKCFRWKELYIKHLGDLVFHMVPSPIL